MCGCLLAPVCTTVVSTSAGQLWSDNIMEHVARRVCWELDVTRGTCCETLHISFFKPNYSITLSRVGMKSTVIDNSSKSLEFGLTSPFVISSEPRGERRGHQILCAWESRLINIK